MNSPISFQKSSYYNNFIIYHVSIAYFLRGFEGGGSNILWKLKKISASLRLLAEPLHSHPKLCYLKWIMGKLELPKSLF